MATENGYALHYWSDMANAIIDGYDGDPEGAHSEEDDLLAEFVRGVADGTVPDPAAAAATLKRCLLDVQRVRWYA